VRRGKDRGHANLGWLDSYDQRDFAPDQRRGRILLLVSPDGRDGSISSRQDGFVYGALLSADDRLSHVLAPGRRAYVRMARGRARVNGELLEEGDGASILDTGQVRLDGIGDAEILLFDLP